LRTPERLVRLRSQSRTPRWTTKAWALPTAV
jgi:hypothetical protein